jgi:hypothetical protein
MESIAESDHWAKGNAPLDPERERVVRSFRKVPWTAWAGFGGNWLSAPDAYWRRRFLILASGLIGLGLLTWGASALLGPAKPIGAGQSARAVAENRKTLPPAAYGLPAMPPTDPASASSEQVGPNQGVTSAAAPVRGGLTPSGPPAGSIAASVGGPAQPSPARGTATAGPGVTASPAAGCQPGSIVLSLFTGKPRYGPAEQPRFTVYVVSTAQAPCRVAYAPPFARVVVTRNGQVVWDSAACAAADGGVRSASLTPGVPTVVLLAWNRKAPSQGCAGSAPAGTTGPMAAVAMAAGKSSPVHWFTLSR